ncbi:hypothetical protein NM208_g5736 [Fusarium decemcellulare]|uniref:Uncharacterized protein n=1 Tax=Fusarium decemcellulare TaxID=57161 RepID=A0ACC1SG42_9HYPO|nr:hypothetical protein NM208_g5736 [Fusarium decemcellulare]
MPVLSSLFTGRLVQPSKGTEVASFDDPNAYDRHHFHHAAADATSEINLEVPEPEAQKQLHDVLTPQKIDILYCIKAQGHDKQEHQDKETVKGEDDLLTQENLEIFKHLRIQANERRG